MATLVIHAPYWKAKPGQPYSWETYFRTGIGRGYAISRKDVDKLRSGSKVVKVVLLRNDYKQRRAEGVLVDLKDAGKTPQGVGRYDVYFSNQKEVSYIYNLPKEKLNLYGVAVIDD